MITCAALPCRANLHDEHIQCCATPHLPEYHLWVYAMSMYHSQMLPCLIILTTCIVLFFVCIIFLTITKEVMLHLHPFKIIMHAVIIGASLERTHLHAGDEGLIPGPGRSSREGNGNLLQYLAWESPWTEEPGGLQSKGSQKCWTIIKLCYSYIL